MSKLSDIGREEWDQIDPDNINVTFVFTREERREFASELIKAWERFKWDVSYADGRITTPKEFLEENGL